MSESITKQSIGHYLFTIQRADGWHGSVVHTLELASYYSKSAMVSVACAFFTPSLKEEFGKHNVNLVLLNEVDLSIKYDVVFGRHHPTLTYLLGKGLDCRKLVLCSFSTIEPVELYPSYFKHASVLTSNSLSGQEKLAELNHISKDNIFVLENFVPDEFIKYDRKIELPPKPFNIIIVSNHVPLELNEARGMMPDGTNVTFYGIGGIEGVRITPQILAKYDVVVSIGKTVQYALGMGIPVFVYDRFGGNGYVACKNFDDEAYHNFSGRSSNRKLTAGELVKELLEKYDDVIGQKDIILKKTVERFLLSKEADKLIEHVFSSKDFSRLEVINNDYFNYEFQMAEAYCDNITNLYSRIQFIENKYTLGNHITAKLYLDYGNGFNENDVLVHSYVIKEDSFSVSFKIHNIDSIKNIRFDPAECSCSCFIKFSEDYSFSPRNSTATIDNFDLFANDDPQYDIRLKDSMLKEVTIEGHIKMTDYSKVISCLIERNNKLKRENESLINSTSWKIMSPIRKLKNITRRE